MASIGSNIKAHREEKGLSQKELAELTNVTPGMIARIEIDNKDPSWANICAIARALNIEIEQLVKGVGPKN